MELIVGSTYDLGEKSFSEKEIIDFALDYDPLPFHIDKEAAKKSIFKSLVASGSHIFHWFYKEKWLPEFGDSVMAGLQLDKWRFLLPVYANTIIRSRVSLASIIPNNVKNTNILQWKFEFFNEKNEMVQSLELTILHKKY